MEFNSENGFTVKNKVIEPEPETEPKDDEEPSEEPDEEQTEKLTEKPSEKTPPKTEEKQTDSAKAAPKTGDDTPLIQWATLLFASMALVIGFTLQFRRKRKK